MTPPSAPMTRLRAERTLAAALRIPRVADGAASGGASAVASPTAVALARRRSLSRLLSRGPAALLSATSEFYLQQSGVQLFVEDLARQLAESRPEHPALFVANYFGAVVRGAHVKGREFEFVHGCQQNRAAFLAHLQRCYAKVDPAMPLTAADFAELVWCQCRDLPRELLRRASCHLPASDDGLVRAPLQFLGKAFEAFSEVLPQGSAHSESVASAMSADRVIAKLRVAVQQNGFPAPPMSDVELLVLQAAGFREFCALFYQSAAVADSIAALQLALQHLAA